MLQHTLVTSVSILMPDALQQLEVVRLVGDHLLFLNVFLLVLEPDEGELPVEIVFLFQEPVELPHEQFFPESFAVGLELPDFIELIPEISLDFTNSMILVTILMHKFADIFLKLPELDVSETAIGKKNGFLAVGTLCFLLEFGLA